MKKCVFVVLWLLNREVVRMEETRLNVMVPADLARRFKAACALRGMSQKQVMIFLIEMWLDREGTDD